MPLSEEIKALASRIPGLKERLSNNEEATKTALVLPFFGALGYDYTDPDEVMPEFDASWADTKGWKADYALMLSGEPIVIVECKTVSNNLCNVTPQLGRYFPLTEARIGLLTNGILYKFYTDQDRPNSMDREPFWVLDLEALTSKDFEQLETFSKGADLTQAVEAASELNHIKQIKTRLASQLETPDDAFVDLYGRELHSGGNYTQPARDRFRTLVQTAFQEFIREQIISGAGRAADTITIRPTTSPEDDPESLPTHGGTDVDDVDVAVSEGQPTLEEIEGYELVKSIVGEIYDPTKVTIRDAQQYCAVFWDDNNRRPLCRLHLNRAQRYIGLFDGTRASSGALNENRYPIANVQEISNFALQLQETAQRYQDV